MTRIPPQTAASNDRGTMLIARRHLDGHNRWTTDWDPGASGGFTKQFGEACQRAKWDLGYTRDQCKPSYGATLNSYMVAKTDDDFHRLPPKNWVRRRARHGRRNPFAAYDGYPLSVHGQIIGTPYVGTHLLYGNWESDNAVDISADTGTPVLAVQSGTIGPQIGPLSTGGDPRLLGLRLHLVTTTNEWYYAHLTKLDVRAGQHVVEGQRLGLSGSANGVEHLHFAQHHGDPGAMIGEPTPGYHDRNYPG